MAQTHNQVEQHHDPYHGFGTLCIHAGQEPDPITGAVNVPISLATTFSQISPGVKHGMDCPYSYGNGFEYSRTGNPTRAAFERCVAGCEHGKHGIAFSSGMGATMTIMHMLKAGDHIISIDDVYGGTQRYFRRVLKPHTGIEATFVDLTTTAALEAAFTPNTKLLWIETPTNPLLKIADVEACCAIAHSHNVLVVVDNTFMSPYLQNPLDLGCDIVVHSVTKYIGGHSDVVMGIVVTSNDAVALQLRFLQNGLGAVPSPFDCYMALRGIKTLHVRMEAICTSAKVVANYLLNHHQVNHVIYPGLPNHPQYELGQRQMKGAGGMISFLVKGELNIR